jgi:hypothetical protein
MNVFQECIGLADTVMKGSRDMKQYSRLLFVLQASFLIVLCTALLLTPLSAGAASVTGQQASHHAPHFFVKKGGHPQASSNDVIYGGGSVMTGTANVYAIFWEPGNNVATGYNSLIQRYFRDVGGSPLYEIASQYPQSGGGFASNARLAASWVDTGAYPQNPLFDSNIQQEVTHAQQVNGWQSSLNNIFFVFLDRGQNLCADNSQTQCASNDFCAYHSYFGSNTLYAALPYAASFSCNPGSSPNSNDADQTINAISHEQMEAATDPLLNGWRDLSGYEIADKCVSQFGPLDQAGGNVVWNGHEYIVQQEWDDNTSSCRLTASAGLSSLPGTWTQCASEQDICAFSGTMTVAYGADGRYWYRVISNGTVCNNFYFGGDPNYGTVKACYLEPVPPVSNVWTECAVENGNCSFSGTMTVAYGANGKFNYLTLNNGTACNNSVFGDPNYGTVKSCYLMAAPPNSISWTLCAYENDACYFSGTLQVAYGANGKFFYKNLSNELTCDNGLFGDPNPGTVKDCYYN